MKIIVILLAFWPMAILAELPCDTNDPSVVAMLQNNEMPAFVHLTTLDIKEYIVKANNSWKEQLEWFNKCNQGAARQIANHMDPGMQNLYQTVLTNETLWESILGGIVRCNWQKQKDAHRKYVAMVEKIPKLPVEKRLNAYCAAVFGWHHATFNTMTNFCFSQTYPWDEVLRKTVFVQFKKICPYKDYIVPALSAGILEENAKIIESVGEQAQPSNEYAFSTLLKLDEFPDLNNSSKTD